MDLELVCLAAVVVVTRRVVGIERAVVVDIRVVGERVVTFKVVAGLIVVNGRAVVVWGRIAAVVVVVG